MKQIPTMIDYVTSLPAADFNQIPLELQHLIQDTNQTLSGSNLFQASTATAIYSAIGDFYIDSGTANAYVISKTSFTADYKIRALPELFVGASFRFIAAHTNTGASTVNIDSLGAIQFVLPTGGSLPANSILAGREVFGFVSTLTPTPKAVITNPQGSLFSSVWAPWTISGLLVSPGTDPTTQYNVSAGNAVDQSGNINCMSSGAITNKNVAATWAEGSDAGAVVSADFPLTAGETVYIFELWKNDQISFDSAITTDPTGDALLADSTISGAGFVYCRRVAFNTVPVDSTVRAINQTGIYTNYVDNFSTYATIPDNSTTPALIDLAMPAIRAMVILFIKKDNPSATLHECACYSGNAVENPFDGNRYYNSECRSDSGIPVEWNTANSGVPIETNDSGQVNFVASNNSGSSWVTVMGWIDERNDF
jgi:hypothetical protein